jgi:hypothetical protein
LFKREGSSLNFDLHKRMKEAHSRIIWALNWSHDDALFATASREKGKSIKVWNGFPDEQLGTPHSELPSGSVPQATSL